MPEQTPPRDDQTPWSELRRIVEGALELNEPERSKFIEQSCDGNHELATAVRNLLQSTDEARHESGKSNNANRDKTTIGGFTLVSHLGEGGFGEVWLAEQCTPVKRSVALKIIKPGMDSSQVVARFEAERQALALMEHPNIASIFDGGETEDGRPYFVMEFVKGTPITRYCKRMNLNLVERVNLMRKVCAAVQHAHQKGVIHRDLKPSNVLVTEVDGEPVPKVIDFGIAKALERPLTDKTLFTEFRQFLGTPEYMSPEQASLSLTDVDTRSDVYALGVLLYEILAGSPPFDPKSLRSAGFDEMRRIIREEEPPLPSSRLSRGTTSVGDDATDPPDSSAVKIGKLIRGELDWIVQRAMAKERDRRYASANELSADLARYINHEPVEAGPLSRTYRVRRFLGAHRVGVAFCGLSLAALITIVILLGIGSLLLSEKVEQVEMASAEARRQQAIATAVNEFLTEDLLASAAPSDEDGEGREVLLREVLDAADQKIDGERFAEDPAVEAAIRLVIGQTYFKLGEYPKAEPQFERALKLSEKAHGRDHLNMMEVMQALGTLYYFTDRYDEAEAFFQEVHDWHHAHSGPEAVETLRMLSVLGGVYDGVGRDEEAEETLRRALLLQKKLYGEEDEDTLRTTTRLASFLDMRGRTAESHPLHTQLFEHHRDRYGIGDPNTMRIRHNLAINSLYRGEFEEAKTILADMVEHSSKILGPEHPGTLSTRQALADACYHLARKQASQGNAAEAQIEFDETEKLINEVYEARERVLGENHLDTLVSLNLSALLASRRSPEEAAPIFRRIYEGLSNQYPPEHPRVLAAQAQVAYICGQTGEYEEAVTVGREVLATFERCAPDHINIKHVRGNISKAEEGLAKKLHEEERYEEMIVLLEPALGRMQNTVEPSKPIRIRMLSHLANSYKTVGRSDDAEVTFQQLFEACEAAIAKVEAQTQLTAPEKELQVTKIRVALARALSASGRHQEGLEIARKANDWFTEFGDPENPAANQAQELLTKMAAQAGAATAALHEESDAAAPTSPEQGRPLAEVSAAD